MNVRPAARPLLDARLRTAPTAIASGARWLRRLPALAALVAAVAFSGCASNDARDRMTTAHGLQTELTALVEIKTAPADAPALTAAIDDAVVKLLDEKSGELVDRALARYDQRREKEQTVIAKTDIEVERETPLTIAQEKSATRKESAGKSGHFRFTVRKGTPHVEPTPTRIELPLVCVEDSRAPSDTITFPQDFRAELVDTVNKAIFQLARDKNLDPTPPRPIPTE